ncbi:MAG: MoaD/ThiS family protein [Deltaproteobacteria bacterium]|nr:MoaD/ThiS family protein [Deltaproteobacteria bacterium]
MIVHIKTVGTLKSLEEGVNPFSLEVLEGTTVSKIINRLNLKDWEIGFIQINGTRATKESIIQDQDELTLIAPLVGG